MYGWPLITHVSSPKLFYDEQLTALSWVGNVFLIVWKAQPGIDIIDVPESTVTIHYYLIPLGPQRPNDFPFTKISSN